MNDTLADVDEVTAMLRSQSQYEVEKKDAELTLEKKDKELQTLLVSKKNLQMNYLFVALMLALLLAFVFYLVYRNKRQHAVVLENKNGQIETLIRELHHRVKNNLQVVSGLLSLQSNRMEDEAARQAMDEGRNRVDAMAMIHQKLYMDKEIAGVDIKDYLQNLSVSLAGSFGFNAASVSTDVQIQTSSMDIDRAIPIGLIVNELITNAFKHAFSDIADPHISIRLSQADNELELQIADNGIGYETINSKTGSFGMKLVNTLVSQLDGKMEMYQDKGTVYCIKMRA
jgi:two-component sensor histidine kinase